MSVTDRSDDPASPPSASRTTRFRTTGCSKVRSALAHCPYGGAPCVSWLPVFHWPRQPCRRRISEKVSPCWRRSVLAHYEEGRNCVLCAVFTFSCALATGQQPLSAVQTHAPVDASHRVRALAVSKPEVMRRPSTTHSLKRAGAPSCTTTTHARRTTRSSALPRSDGR